MELSDYLRVKDAAKFLKVNEMTLRRWSDAGKLNSKRHPINNYRLYAKKDLEKFKKKLGE